MQKIKEDEKINISTYERYNNLLNTPKWKCVRRLINNPKNFISIYKIFFDQTRQNNIKYKYLIKITWNVK